MSVYTLHEGFPNIPLTAGMKIVLEAIDPTTGADVAGVEASRWSIYGDDQSDTGLGQDVVPLLTPEEVGGGSQEV